MANSTRMGGMARGLLGGLLPGAPESSYDKDRFNVEANVAQGQKRLNSDVEIRNIKLVQQLQEQNLKDGKKIDEGVEELRHKLEKKAFSFFVDELRDMFTAAKNAETKGEVKAQLQRIEEGKRAMINDPRLDMEERQFLSRQYEHGGDAMKNDIMPRKRGLGGTAIEAAKEQVGNYMSIRGLVEGAVQNNPLLMGLYGVGAAVTKQAFANSKLKKTQTTDDKLKQQSSILDDELEADRAGAQSEYDAFMAQQKGAPRMPKPTPDDDGGDDTQAEAAQEKRQLEQMMKEEERESDSQHAEHMEKLDTIVSLLEGGSMVGSKDGKKEEESGGMGFLESLGMYKLLKGFFGKLFGGLARMLPMLLPALGIATMIGSLVNGLWEGITDGWDKFMETGSIADAIYEGATSLLSGMTFGLIDKETIQGFFDMIGEYIGKLIFDIVEWVKGAANSVGDTIAEYVPFVDSDREARLNKAKKAANYAGEGNFMQDQTVSPARLMQMDDEQLDIVRDYAKNEGDDKVVASIDAEMKRRNTFPTAVVSASPKTAQNMSKMAAKANDIKLMPDKANDASTNVVQQNNVMSKGGGAAVPQLPLTSARNPDSSIQRVADRTLAFGM